MKFPYQNRNAYWAAVAGGVCLTAVIAYHVICGEHGYLAYRQAKRQYNILRQQADQVHQENQKLQQHIDALDKRDPATIEKQAREQLHMTKPGEIVFTLPEAEPKAQTSPAAKDPKAATP
ncbi:MAG TPA: septum formation initiator family protein [Terriglobia bacterium]|nr:septum formation initiator family protein [Terriglobia bacterium]